MEKYISGITNMSYLSNGNKDILIFGHRHNLGVINAAKENYKYNCKNITLSGHMYTEDLFRDIYERSNILGNKITYFIEGSEKDWMNALHNVQVKRQRSNFIDSNLFFYKKFIDKNLNGNRLIFCDTRKSTIGNIYKSMIKLLYYELWSKQNISNEEIEQFKSDIMNFLTKANDYDTIHRHVFDNDPDVEEKFSGINYIGGVKNVVNDKLNVYLDYIHDEVKTQDNNRNKYIKLRRFIVETLSRVINYRLAYYVNNKEFGSRLILNYGSQHHDFIVEILIKIGWKLQQKLSGSIDDPYCINIKLFRDIQFGGSKKRNKIINNNIKKQKSMKGGAIDISHTFRPLGDLEKENYLAHKLINSDDDYEAFNGIELYVNIHKAKLSENKIGGVINEKKLNCNYCKKKYTYVKNLMKHIYNKHK